MIASDTFFDSRGGLIFGVKLSDEDVADFEVLRDVAMTTIFGFINIWGAHWRHLKNTTEPSMCGGDAALCQITLTTCCCCCYRCCRRQSYFSRLWSVHTLHFDNTHPGQRTQSPPLYDTIQ